MKTPILALFSTLFVVGNALAGPFEVSIKTPAYTVHIPDFESFPLGPHPNDPKGLWLLGSNKEGITVSVLTHSLKSNPTPAQCASIFTGDTLQKYAPPLDELRINRISESTYSLVFPFRVGKETQLKAFILSGTGAGHCIQVHMSRLNATPEQRDAWLSGFKAVSVEIQ